jgi:SNF2 family DNA or RNA helicase
MLSLGCRARPVALARLDPVAPNGQDLHYDRWWNAAREDQATDRMYRLGQNKAVSVLKLTTEGTLEEKISAIIERKRRLMHEVVRVDEPGESKTFTRDELIGLLEPLEAV